MDWRGLFSNERAARMRWRIVKFEDSCNVNIRVNRLHNEKQCVAVDGWFGSGKTTLICRMLPHLIRPGLSVSTVKRSHKGFDIDHSGKDSFAHRKAGACKVVVGSALGEAPMHTNQGDEGGLDLDCALDQMDVAGIVLVEGLKTFSLPPIEAYHTALDEPLPSGDHDRVIASALDDGVGDSAVPIISPYDVTRYVNGRHLAQSNARHAMAGLASTSATTRTTWSGYFG